MSYHIVYPYRNLHQQTGIVADICTPPTLHNIYIQVHHRHTSDEKNLLSRLYYFHAMHNGCAVFYAEEQDAVEAGFAFLVEAEGIFPYLLSTYIFSIHQLFARRSNEYSNVSRANSPGCLRK
jgi:hypothetical protein